MTWIQQRMSDCWPTTPDAVYGGSTPMLIRGSRSNKPGLAMGW